MPAVKVQLENGQFTHYDYDLTCTTHQLSASICRKLYGAAYEAYTQFGEIGIWEVCQPNVQRRTRSYERVSEIVATWPPKSGCYLRLEQSPETLQCDPLKTRLKDVTAMYSLLNQDWQPCTIDIYDKLFHLRTTQYNGLWRSLDLQDVDVYDSNLPDIVILRSQVAYEQLPDKVDRMIVIRTSPEQAKHLRTLVFTLRTQWLMSPNSYSFNSPTIGPPPSVLPPGPPESIRIPSMAPAHLEHAHNLSISTGRHSQSSSMSSVVHRPPVQVPSLSAPVSAPPAIPSINVQDLPSPSVPAKDKVKGPVQGSFPNPRLHSPQLLAQPPMLTPPSSPPGISSHDQEMMVPLTPPPVPPKDKPRRKSKKRVARRHCPVIEGEIGTKKVWEV